MRLDLLLALLQQLYRLSESDQNEFLSEASRLLKEHQLRMEGLSTGLPNASLVAGPELSVLPVNTGERGSSTYRLGGRTAERETRPPIRTPSSGELRQTSSRVEEWLLGQSVGQEPLDSPGKDKSSETEP